MRPILQPCARTIPAFRRYLFRSAGTLSSSELHDGLHRHIAGKARKASFVPVLDPSDLRSIIETLRGSKRVSQALKVSEWMSEQQVCNLIPEDFVVRLNLTDNVLGLEEAEKFFHSIPEDKIDDSVHTTLLSFYARSEKTLDKAESIFQKMRGLGYLSKPSPFNHMMSLYIQLGKRDMVLRILSQMETNNVKPDNRTLNIKLLLLADCDTSTLHLDWRSSCELARICLKQGLVVEAVKMLRRAEESVEDDKSKKLAYESLMVLYGEAGKAEEVYRIWELYKKMTWMYKDNEGYRSVISSLLKLNHIDKAGTILKDHDEINSEVRIVTMMASAYCEKGQIEDAEELFHKHVHRLMPIHWRLITLGAYFNLVYSMVAFIPKIFMI